MQASDAVASGDLASVWMDGTLYETPSTGNFLVRLSVVNQTGSTIYVDLRDYWGLIRPIQYSGSETPDPAVVDISFQTPPELTDSLRDEILAGVEEGSLEPVNGYGQLDYYVDFNAAGRDRIDGLDSTWLLLALGGWITVSDSASTELLSPADGFVFVPIQMPVSWSEVPDRSIIAFDSPAGPRIKRIGASGV